ncbi:glycosyltransferase involved in cell wall biosynthesis [Arcticibacter pallidicorallinus]|uniref:Glycosyltransferase involved in cell wall biosynthesis n=1 Tax=Arcticibacter pallidicorallinus TaxID=1259464 RepID=A0A2T0UBC7_9SPHI|nr:glycosyltransferase family 4 protein [Arcticibacter pallidicorallinus]PRY55251.1 glycosyltransferase involved in cell wall biosynthesis [Arcticibacter pallidicorallinus]
MKIAVLAPVAWRTPPRHYGPWEQVSSNIAEGLLKEGFDVTLFATGDSLTDGSLEWVTERGYEEDKGVDAKVVECLHISHLMERADQFDLIHNNFDFLPLTYSSLVKTPFLTTIHGFSSEKIVPVYKKYNRSTSYVSISNANRHADLDYLGTVYNGLQTEQFSFNAHPEDYLLFFGRIHPDKGTAEAIQIAQRSNRRLIIAGIIQDAEYFRERVEPFLSDTIVFVGDAGPEKRNDLLGKASALLHPISFEEPFGLSVAESMLCGTPVIAFNRGSMPELIRHGETGFLVASPDEAVEAVELLNDISRQECRDWSFSQFSKEKMVKDYILLYRKILSGF